MNAVARKQPVRCDGNGIRCTVATERTDEALFNELDSLGEVGSVAKLKFQSRNARTDHGVRVVRGIRQFRHGDAEQLVEARRLEMNGEVVDETTDRQASPSVRLRTHHGDTRRGVTVISPGAINGIRVGEEECQ